jgi:hypothetical protein
MKRRMPVLIAAASTACAAMAASSMFGSEVDCLAPEFMGDIRIVEDFPVSSSQSAIAKEVALANSFAKGALGREAQATAVRFGTVATSTLGMDDGKPAFVVAVQSDAEPYRMVGTPVGSDAPFVTAPCQIVVLDTASDFLFSYSMQFEVEATTR